jgi:GH25 family lysozyme M1 (1,4-beta-N-acetylmuramidase)
VQARIVFRVLVAALSTSVLFLVIARGVSASPPEGPAASEQVFVEAVDWSLFQPAHTERDMRRLREAGVGLVIVGGWHGDNLGVNPNCRHDLALARTNHLKTGLYVVLDSSEGTDATGAVHKARANCGEEWDHATFVALDVELAGVTTAEIRAGVDEVRRLGKTPVIYTAYWFWHEMFGDPQDLCDVPVWNAFYDWSSDFNFAELPYGCWTPDQVVAEQYQPDSKLPGLEMDHNSFKGDFLYVAEVEKNRYLAKQQGYIAALVGRAQTAAACDPYDATLRASAGLPSDCLASDANGDGLIDAPPRLGRARDVGWWRGE